MVVEDGLKPKMEPPLQSKACRQSRFLRVHRLVSPLPGARRRETFDAVGATEVAISFQWHQNGLSGRCRVLNTVW